MTLINAHSHNIDQRYITILQIDDISHIPDNTFFSFGINPSQSTSDKSAIAAQFAIISANKNLIAIGETGLDNRYPNAAEQEQCYIAQLKIAQSLHKPVILHCVNEWDRCRKLHQTFAPETPLIYHGFTKPAILERVLSYPNAFISLGKRLVFSEPLQQAVKEVPLNRIFLETDNDDFELKEAYEKLAAIKSLPLATLTKQLYQNYTEVFHHGKLA